MNVTKKSSPLKSSAGSNSCKNSLLGMVKLLWIGISPAVTSASIGARRILNDPSANQSNALYAISDSTSTNSQGSDVKFSSSVSQYYVSCENYISSTQSDIAVYTVGETGNVVAALHIDTSYHYAQAPLVTVSNTDDVVVVYSTG